MLFLYLFIYIDQQQKFSPLRQEIREGEFQRVIQLPRGVKNEDINASMKDGLLCIKITKPEKEASGRQSIPITFEGGFILFHSIFQN